MQRQKEKRIKNIKKEYQDNIIMNVVYIIAGITLILFGIWQVRINVRNIARKRVSILGSDIQLLGVGIGCIICGIIIIVQHI